MADADTKDRRQAETLHNPASDPNSGNVAWIFLALMMGSLAWFLVDPTLRRGLSQATGLHFLSPLVEELITTEYTIQVHGTWTSTCTQRVLLVAHEKELDIRLQFVDTIAKQHKSDSHLQMQPFGQIPVLELEDHQYLFESRAIAQFLARRYADRGTPLHVHGVMAKAFYEEALSIEAFDFDPLAAVIFREAVMKPRSGALADSAAIEIAKTALENKLDGYEKLLSGRHWLGGYNLTLADLYHLPYGQKIINAGHGAALMDAKNRPHVAKWWKALSERPSWKAVLSDVEKWQEAEAKRKADEQAAAEKA